MSALLLLMLVVAAAPDAGVDAPKGVPNVLGAMKSFVKQGHEGVTACGSCHGTSSWTEVRFNHERTGFPLTGKHARTSCKSCHVADFNTPLPRGCVGCHQDVHSGELGARCEGCHDTADWRSRFDADAHRRTNFPLLGAHAALPCVECHAEARERRFSRAAVDCAACHQQSVLRSQSVDHEDPRLKMRSCRECHAATNWTPARFPTHDACFPITAGPHAGIACLGCHVRLGPSMGQCNSGTASLCISCHTNAGGSGITATDAQHQGVPGYSFSASKCAQCHAGAGGAP